MVCSFSFMLTPSGAEYQSIDAIADEVSEVCSGDWKYYNMISNDLV